MYFAQKSVYNLQSRLVRHTRHVPIDAESSSKSVYNQVFFFSFTFPAPIRWDNRALPDVYFKRI